MNQKTRIALVQMANKKDTATNLDHALSQIEAAAKKKAHIVCLQELFCGPYFCQTNDDSHFMLATPIPSDITKTLSGKAKECGVVIIASVFEKDGKDYYNTALILDTDGTIAGKYRKVHIPDDLQNHYSEKYYFKAGNLGIKAAKTKAGMIGVLVCWDQWYPEAARALAIDGAQIIFYPTAIGWPAHTKPGAISTAEYDAWITIQRSHAIANGIFVAACNRVGTENNLSFWGGSFVADPYGRILDQLDHQQENTLIADCDLSLIKNYRDDWPFLTCRRSDIY